MTTTAAASGPLDPDPDAAKVPDLARLWPYLQAHATPADEVLADLARETRERYGARSEMQVTADEGALLALLARVVRPRLVLEVGTFTGYSTICLARGLAPEGRVVTLDVDPAAVAVATRAFERAGLAERIEVHLGDAGEFLAQAELGRPIDLAFIDADKPSYQRYFEEVLRRLAPDGLVVVDNTLWKGRVAAAPADHDADTQVMAEFNDSVRADPRVDSVILAAADGVTLAVRRDGLPAGRQRPAASSGGPA